MFKSGLEELLLAPESALNTLSGSGLPYEEDLRKSVSPPSLQKRSLLNSIPADFATPTIPNILLANCDCRLKPSDAGHDAPPLAEALYFYDLGIARPRSLVAAESAPTTLHSHYGWYLSTLIIVLEETACSSLDLASEEGYRLLLEKSTPPSSDDGVRHSMSRGEPLAMSAYSDAMLDANGCYAVPPFFLNPLTCPEGPLHSNSSLPPLEVNFALLVSSEKGLDAGRGQMTHIPPPSDEKATYTLLNENSSSMHTMDSSSSHAPDRTAIQHAG